MTDEGKYHMHDSPQRERPDIADASNDAWREAIRVRLAAYDTPPSPDAVEALRQRVLAAAAPALAARAARPTLKLIASTPSARPSWLEAMGAIGRFAIPVSLAAAVLAIVLLRQLPAPATSDDIGSSLAYTAIGESVIGDATTTAITDGLLELPESADDVLLASPLDGQPQ